MPTKMAGEVADDGLKWFGEGFDGFPKRLPDDCVEYAIYIIDPNSTTPPLIRSRLNEIFKSVDALRKTHLKEYIWQREAFELKHHPKLGATTADAEAKPPLPPHLRGRTNFGDSVADEWLVVFLLLELSRQYSDAWIRVYDTDGEFLLIEAANALPKWLIPEIAENRVWLNDGQLKIVTPEDVANPGNLSLQQAVSTFLTSPERILHDSTLESEAFYRIREYPSAISSTLHHALITIPRRLAYILHRNPAYVSPAIEAFYLRDPISLKPLTTKDLATLNFAPEDFVTVSTRFTKVGYAQLRSQMFDPPPAWTGIKPRMHDEKMVMGMKLTCGFEMLATDQQNRDARSVREIKLLLEDVETGDEELPTDGEMAAWPRVQNDAKWLDIDYNDFDRELSGKKPTTDDNAAAGGALNDHHEQEKLRKMVSRFQDFLDDDEDADAEDIDSDIDDDESDVSAAKAEDHEDAGGDDVDFEKAMKEAMAMKALDVEKSGLLAEARNLALEDDEIGGDTDEEEEMRKVMELMERELKKKGALQVNDQGKSKASRGKTPASSKSRPVFGPERPPGMRNLAVTKPAALEDSDDDVGPGDGELSSDDEEFNDVNLGLAKNMLESFKGQAGLSGPAGNLMRAMGINMPRDEGDVSDDD